MNQNEILRSMNAENKMLRMKIGQLERANAQADFMEKLIAGALTGYCAQPWAKDQPEEAARLANQAANRSLELIAGAVDAVEEEMKKHEPPPEDGESLANPPDEPSKIIC